MGVKIIVILYGVLQFQPNSPKTIFQIDECSKNCCFEEQKDGLTWPKTPTGSIEFPEEPNCFDNNFNKPWRLCRLSPDKDEPQWTDAPKCDFYNISPYTDQLYSMSQKPTLSDQMTIRLKDISRNYKKLSPIDFCLFANFLNKAGKIQSNGNYSLHVIAQLADNFLNTREEFRVDCVEFIDSVVKLAEPFDNFTFVGDNFNLFILGNDTRGLMVDTNNSVSLDVDFEDIKGNVLLLYAVLWTFEQSKIIVASFKAATKDVQLATNFIVYVNILGLEGTKLENPLNVVFRGKKNLKGQCGFSHNYSERFWATTVPISMKTNDSELYLCQYSHFGYFALVRSPSVTEILLQLLRSKKSKNLIISNLANTTEQFQQFQAQDVAVTAKILEKISDDQQLDLNNVAKIVTNLQWIHRGILEQSQSQNGSIDLILRQIDKILNNHTCSDTYTEISSYNFAIVISNSSLKGLLISENRIEPIYDDFLGKLDQNFTSGVILSSALSEQLLLAKDSKIIFTIYFQDQLFIEEQSHRDPLNNVIGVILPEVVKGPLRIIQKQGCCYKYKPTCTFWNQGAWQLELSSNITIGLQSNKDWLVCDYDHASHYAILQKTATEDEHWKDEILDRIKVATCGLSVFGLLIIFATAVFFEQWRTDCSNKLLVNFATAIALELTTFFISDTVDNDDANLICIIIGALLHYSIVSQFCWTLVFACLQFRKFVQVYGVPSNHIVIKSLVCGWILPLFPVLCLVAFDPQNYVQSDFGLCYLCRGLCYPSGLGLYLGVWLPVAMIITINVVMFAIIIYHVVNRSSKCCNRLNNDVFYQGRLVVLLFFILEINWTFGFLYEIYQSLIFAYLFTLTVALQGFLLFLLFIVLNRKTRRLYYEAFERFCYSLNWPW